MITYDNPVVQEFLEKLQKAAAEGSLKRVRAWDTEHPMPKWVAGHSVFGFTSEWEWVWGWPFLRRYYRLVVVLRGESVTELTLDQEAGKSLMKVLAGAPETVTPEATVLKCFLKQD